MTGLRHRLNEDEGTTLAELIVGMGVMVVFMTIFTTVIFMMNNASAHTEAVEVSSSSVNGAFLQLDKTIRYASSISQPSAAADSNGNWFVEIQTTNTGTTVCTQLKLDTQAQKLSSRTWTMPTSTSYTQPSNYTLIASQVTANGTPFTLTANGSVPFEQLTIALSSTQGSGQSSVTTNSSMTFVAVNSAATSRATKTNPGSPATVCTGPPRQ
jgi:hypothetical protein